MKKLTLCLLIISFVFSAVPAFGQDQQNFLILMKTKMAIMEKEKAALQLREKHQYSEAAKVYEESILMEMQALQGFQGDQASLREIGQMMITSLLSLASCYQNSDQFKKAEQMLAAAMQCAVQMNDEAREFDVCEAFSDFYAVTGNFQKFRITYASAYELLRSMIQKEWGLTIDLKDSRTYKPVVVRFEQELSDIIAKKGSDDKKSSRELVDRINRIGSLDLRYIRFLSSTRQFEAGLAALNDENSLAFQNAVSRLVTPGLIKRLTAELQKGSQENLVDAVTFTGNLYILYGSNFDSIQQTITERGMFQRYLGLYKDALVSFNEAGKILEQAEKDGVLGAEILTIYRISNTFHKARTIQKMGDRRKAIDMYGECIKLCEKTPYYKQFILPKLYLFTAEASLENGDAASASAMADRSEKAWQEIQAEPEIIWQLYSLKGKLAEKKGETAKAVEHYLKAVQMIEKFRANLFIDQSMEGFIGERLDPYNGIVRIYTAQGKTREALLQVEQVRARCLSEQMVSSLNELIINSPIADADRQQMLYLWLSIAFDRYSLNGMAQSKDPGRRQQILEMQNRLNSNYDKLMEMVRSKCGVELANLMGEGSASLEKIQQLLDKDTVYLEYFSYDEDEISPGKLILWAVTAGDIQCFVLPASPSAAVKSIEELRMAIDGCDPGWKPISQKLYADLISPAEAVLKGKKRIIISPYRALHYIPFHALLDSDGVPLVQRYPLVYSPSLSAFLIGKSRASGVGDRAVAFSIGNVKSGRFSPLPGTKDEVKAISGILRDCKVIQEKDFTSRCVSEYMNGRDIVHFATHGDLNPDSPKESGLITSDGKLFIDDILRLKMRARLVVLSACSTNLGRLFPGEDQVGITRAFMYAGAPSIVSSLWSVSDESTAKLMTCFYSNLAKKMDKDEALRQAELTLMKEYPDPVHWAPFILTGDWK